MRILVEKASELSRVKIILLLLMLFVSVPLHGQTLSLEKVVTPSSVIEKDGKIVTFAIHGYVEFKSLAGVFGYIESQMKRWKGKISDEDLQKLRQGLLREGIESRVISMMDERPVEALVTHTSEELQEAVAQVREALPAGYAETFLAVQAKWKHSLNCWSTSPVIAGRVLSNWYPINEGIQLYGAAYDSTEHFWQAAKYHPDLTVGELKELVAQLEARNWIDWFKRLDSDPKLYLPNAYAVEFLRHSLEPERVWWFLTELDGHGLKPSDHVRQTQQRGEKVFRFTAYEEKVLWGDLADVLHLVFLLSPADDPLRKKIEQAHFDGIYLGERKMGFISDEFRSQMLEIWKVKFLQMARFREVISSIPMEIRLEHFLNDGDSPDIPIPVYVGYLNQIREMAKAKED